MQYPGHRLAESPEGRRWVPVSRRASYNYSIDYAARAAARALQQAEYERRRAERDRRQAEWAQRTSEITSAHLDRYQSILDDLRAQGLVEFVSTEFDEISRLVADARSLTRSNPAAARDLSRQIGPRLGPLPRTARQLRGARRDADAPDHTREVHKRQRGAAAPPQARASIDVRTPSTPIPPVENPTEVAWREALAGWSDFLARDLAFGDLAALRQQVTSQGTGLDAGAVKARVQELQDKWGAEADRQRQEETELASLQEQLAEEPPSDDDLTPPEAVDLNEDASTDPEEARREAVQAVMGALEDAGFQVANPRLVNGDVVVVGTRPSGASATFNLTLDGSLEYDFSGYRGSSCDVDIDAVVPALQEVYGIELADEEVAWRNPDDEDAAARPQPGRTRNA